MGEFVGEDEVDNGLVAREGVWSDVDGSGSPFGASTGPDELLSLGVNDICLECRLLLRVELGFRPRK